MKVKKRSWIILILIISSISGCILVISKLGSNQPLQMPKQLYEKHVNTEYYHKIRLGENATNIKEALQMFGKPTTIEKQYRFFQHEEIYTWNTSPDKDEGIRIFITFVGDTAYTKAIHNDRKVTEIMKNESTMTPAFTLEDYQKIKVGDFETGENGMTRQEVFALLRDEPAIISASYLDENITWLTGPEDEDTNLLKEIQVDFKNGKVSYKKNMGLD